jgi:L-ribulose-5-phosphate 3-epimerase
MFGLIPDERTAKKAVAQPSHNLCKYLSLVIMNRLKIGIRLESLGLPLRRALTEVGRLGVAGVQMDALGELAPNALSATGRREFRHLLRAHNLELTALGCPLRRGLDSAENQQPRLEHVQKVLSLSFDLGPRIVIVQAGSAAGDANEPRLMLLRESLQALAHHVDRVGATLALETGLEDGSILAAFLDRFDSGALGVNLDPANLLLHGFDPYASIQALGRRIVHSHAKDARQSSASRAAQEVPLGHGDIDWMKYLAALEEVEYRGWITIERETGESRLADIAAAVSFLRLLIG